MIRVLLLSNMYPSRRWPAYGTFVRGHAEALARSGEVALTRAVIQDPRKGWRTPLKYARLAARAWALSLARHFDIAHVHYAWPTALAAALALRRGARLVITCHGGDVNEMLAERAPAATRRALLRADHLIAVSQDLAGKLRAALGDACPPVTVANMGVDRALFRPDPAPRWNHPAAPHPTSRAAEPARLLFVGRLVAVKGPDVLLRAAALLEVDWRLGVVGDGPQRDAVERLTRELGIADRVAFLGSRPPEDLPDLYRGADLLVGASRQEGLGLALLEGAACGCPVVATRVGGIPEIFTDGDSALLVPPEDPAALAAAITRALTDPPLRRRLIEGALSVADQHSLERSVAHTLNVYRQVLRR